MPPLLRLLRGAQTLPNVLLIKQEPSFIKRCKLIKKTMFFIGPIIVCQQRCTFGTNLSSSTRNHRGRFAQAFEKFATLNVTAVPLTLKLNAQIYLSVKIRLRLRNFAIWLSQWKLPDFFKNIQFLVAVITGNFD